MPIYRALIVSENYPLIEADNCTFFFTTP